MRDFSNKTDLPDLRDPKALGAYLSYYDDCGKPGISAVTDPACLSDAYVDQLLENLTVYAAADCLTWEMRAERALTIPQKKLDFIESLPEKIADLYLDGKSDDAAYWFDLYNALITALHDHTASLAATHAYALARMRICGASEDRITRAQDAFSSYEKRLDALFIAENPAALPAVSRAMERRTARQREALLEAGVAAEEMYAAAIENAEKGKTVSALSSFRKLGDFRDSTLRAIALNRHAKIGNLRVYDEKQFVLMPKKIFLSHKDKETEVPAGKATAADIELDTYRLCKYENGQTGLPVGTPFLSILGHYAGRLFVLNPLGALCSLSTKTEKMTEIFDGETAYRFKPDVDAVRCESGEIALVGTPRTVLYNGKKQTVSLGADTLLLLDPSAASLKNTQEGAAKIIAATGGVVIFETSDGCIRVFDLASQKTSDLCQAADCPKICAVNGDYIYYLAGEKSAPALKRRTIDGSKTETLENHVCDFVYTNPLSLCYTVGCQNEKALYGYFYKENTRKELCRRVFCGADPVVCEQGGCLFVRADVDGKCGLARVPVDGGDNVLLTDDFSKPACAYPFRRGNFYYIDTSNSLLRVSISNVDPANSLVKIASGISSFGCPGLFGDRVTFTKDEGDPTTCGLYSSDENGGGLKKLANGISGFAVLDDGHIIVSKSGEYQTIEIR